MWICCIDIVISETHAKNVQVFKARSIKLQSLRTIKVLSATQSLCQPFVLVDIFCTQLRYKYIHIECHSNFCKNQAYCKAYVKIQFDDVQTFCTKYNSKAYE